MGNEGGTGTSGHRDDHITSLEDIEFTCGAQWQGNTTFALDTWDQQVLAHFASEQPWGMETSVDLVGCDPVAIRDPQHIRAFALALCDVIHMQRYGEPILVHFGAEERVSGYSLVQLIETSAITGHFIEQVDAACLSIFSCASYPPSQAAAFCQQWFRAQEVRLSVLFRGPVQADREVHVGQEKGSEEGRGPC